MKISPKLLNGLNSIKKSCDDWSNKAIENKSSARLNGSLAKKNVQLKFKKFALSNELRGLEAQNRFLTKADAEFETAKKYGASPDFIDKLKIKVGRREYWFSEANEKVKNLTEKRNALTKDIINIKNQLQKNSGITPNEFYESKEKLIFQPIPDINPILL